jgi:hypothetical protein
MPLGIVNNEEFESELNNANTKPVPLPIISPINKGRGIGSVEVPNSLRKIIGETANIEGRKEALSLASDFGISPSSVSAYTAGSTSTALPSNPDIKNHILNAKARVSKKARMKLMNALSHITSDKLQEAKVGEIASVARNMSAIIKDMESDNGSNSEKSKPQFVVFAPSIRQENFYETIHAKE